MTTPPPPLRPRATRLRPAGPLLYLFQRLRAPLWMKLAAGPLAITVLMLLIGVSIVFAFGRIQVLGERMISNSQLIEQATRLQITVRGAVNYSRDVIQDPTQRTLASYFQQRKLVLEGLNFIRQPDANLLPAEEQYLQAIERSLAKTDQMVSLVQDDKRDAARSLWDRQVHDLSDEAVVRADQFKQSRVDQAGDSVVRAVEAIWGSALASALLILAAVVGVLAFAWLNTGLVARPIRLVATAMGRVAAGDVDVRVELSQRDELGLLEQSFNQMTGALRILLYNGTRTTVPLRDGEEADPLEEARLAESALLRRARDTAEASSQLGAELEEAYHIQAALLPPQDQTLHGWHIEASTVPATKLGGDFYDLLNLPNGRLGVVIGDVSGHGAASALLGAWTQGLIAAIAAAEPEPGRVLARVNDALRRRLPHGMMVTLSYIVLDAAAGVLEYANAGHPYPLLRYTGAPPTPDGQANGALLRAGLDLSRDGAQPLEAAHLPPGAAGEWVWLDVPGVPLGLVSEMIYPTARLPLATLDAFCLFSDGVVEAHDMAGAMYGFDRLRETCATLPPDSEEGAHASLAESLVGHAAAFASGHPVEDDMTVLLVRRVPTAATPIPAPADLNVRYTWPPGVVGEGSEVAAGVADTAHR